MLSLIGIVSAVEITTQDAIEDVVNFPPDNWLGRLISKMKFSIFKVGTFTVYGDELGCAKYSTQQNTFKKGDKVILTAEPGETGYVNWFRGSPYDGTYSDHPGDSRQFVGEEYIEYGKEYNSVSWTCDAGAYWNRDCYYDFYSCPFPCYSDSECSSGEFCDKSVLSQKIPNAGVCKVSIPKHTTKVYRCENGEKTDLGEVSHGSLNFCNDPTDSKYLIGTTDQCLPYEPKICYEIPTPINGNGEIIIDTLTWGEFYSMDDEKFGEGNYFCSNTNECPLKEKYSVSCSKDETFRERYYDYFRDKCDESLGWWDELINRFIHIIPGLAQVDICGVNALPYWENKWQSSGGTCIAESTTWYGKAWDKTLQTVGGLGLPAQYILLITIILLITLIGFMLRMAISK